MEKNNSGITEKPKSLIYFLRELQAREADVDLIVESRERHGIIHVRKGNVLSADADYLHGNGAILSLASASSPELTATENDSSIQKSISLTLSQIHKIVSAQKHTTPALTSDQEKQLLKEARMLFSQFHHKLAGQKLITILRSNRFCYPAWLWQSRIISRQDYIGKAIDEAYRWGNHDQVVWREARKIRPQLDGSETSVKRCCFCWSIVDKQGGQCPHCHAFLVISSQPQSELLKSEELKYTLSLLKQAIKLEPSNARIAYSLAVGYFNLKQYQQALEFMRLARKLSPKISLYAKSLTLLTTVAKTQSASEPTVDKKKVAPTGSGNRVLLVEDSMTSRKVLSMLFKRKGYEVIEAANGKEAIEKCQTNRPDLIILDVILPDTTGHELLPQLRTITHITKLPVLMLTGRQSTEDKMRGLSAGVNEYVTKPFNPEKLTNLVSAYLPNVKPVKQKVTPSAKTETPASPVVAQEKKVTPSKPVHKPETITEKKQDDFNPDSKTIFIVEDSPTSRKVLKMILKRSKFNVIEAATGKEALITAEAIAPDLVLLDVMLPDMTGYDILPKIKEMPAYAKTPVFILTGKKAPSDKMKGMLLGSNEYITKPFNPEKLLALINSYI